MAFMSGACTAARINRMPVARASALKLVPNLSSRSRIKNRGAVPNAVVLRSCCVTHALRGAACRRGEHDFADSELHAASRHTREPRLRPWTVHQPAHPHRAWHRARSAPGKDDALEDLSQGPLGGHRRGGLLQRGGAHAPGPRTLWRATVAGGVRRGTETIHPGRCRSIIQRSSGRRRYPDEAAGQHGPGAPDYGPDGDQGRRERGRASGSPQACVR